MIGTDVTQAAELLKKGQVVAIPTETVYGLAANALDLKAVSEIFSVKQRPSFDPLIIHVADIVTASKWVKKIPEKLQLLASQFMPGPLTLLLEKKAIIPDLVTAGSAFVALRIPAHPMTQALLQELDFPLAAPSANPFGYISPTSAAHVEQQLGTKIPYILDGGPCQIGLESTIVGIENQVVTVYRKGGLAIEQIEQLVGSVQVKPFSSSNPQAPGMLKSHYAPHTPFSLEKLEKVLKRVPKDQIAYLGYQQYSESLPMEQQIILSAKGDYKEAAQKLFAAMRTLDTKGFAIIVAELLPEQNLGLAINDRLRRAAAH
jgi:L-threonylcarbamoyladenylate synthase